MIRERIKTVSGRAIKGRIDCARIRSEKNHKLDRVASEKREKLHRRPWSTRLMIHTDVERSHGVRWLSRLVIPFFPPLIPNAALLRQFLWLSPSLLPRSSHAWRRRVLSNPELRTESSQWSQNKFFFRSIIRRAFLRLTNITAIYSECGWRPKRSFSASTRLLRDELFLPLRKKTVLHLRRCLRIFIFSYFGFCRGPMEINSEGVFTHRRR